MFITFEVCVFSTAVPSTKLFARGGGKCPLDKDFFLFFELWGMAVWLDAHQDPVAAIHTTPSCIRCTPPRLRPSLRASAQGATSRSCARRDVTGDGGPKLLLADVNPTP